MTFDGCDEVDEDLNALKSGGGIHTTLEAVKNMMLLIDFLVRS